MKARAALHPDQLRQLAEAARQDLPRARPLAPLGRSFGRITIRAQKSRWAPPPPKQPEFQLPADALPREVRDYLWSTSYATGGNEPSRRFWQELPGPAEYEKQANGSNHGSRAHPPLA